MCDLTRQPAWYCVAGTVLQSRCIAVLFALMLSQSSAAEQRSSYRIAPGESPQPIIDRAPPGSKVVFLPGLHEHGLARHDSIVYVDKSLDIELSEGAVLKLADGATELQSVPEITIDHGAAKKLDDLSVGGTYDGRAGRCYFAVAIDGEGDLQSPDTFRWARLDRESDIHGEYSNQKVAVTGEWQPLSNGLKVRFESKVGHNRGSLWILSCGGNASYGIRIGRGTHDRYIEDVRIHGSGTIDMNLANNLQPTEWVKDISACVLIHGRVRRAKVEEITMVETMRSVMAYGEHTGRFLRGGGTEGGESFDAEHIEILRTKTQNPTGKAYLLGHPSHRGRLTNVKCNHNTMVTAGTALEPNFNLDRYEVIGNTIRSGTLAIHCWRKSSNGLIADNVRIDGRDGVQVVVANSPSAWEDPIDLVIRDNRVEKPD